MEKVNIPKEKVVLSNDIFKRLETISLIDKYEAYQLLDDKWEAIKVDLEIIQTEGFESTKIVDANMVLKKKDGKEVEVQEGWIGRIMPFELVQETYLKEELQSLQEKENRLVAITADYEEIINSLSEEEKDSPILNDNNDAFVTKEVNIVLKNIFADLESEEINILKKYIDLLDNKSKKTEKVDFINQYKQVQWSKIDANNDGTFGKSNVIKYLFTLQSTFTFAEDSFESKMVKTGKLLVEEKEAKKLAKVEKEKLHLATKGVIEQLSTEQVYELLELKWVLPIVNSMNNLPGDIINDLTTKINNLFIKYRTTFVDVSSKINQIEKKLRGLLENLEGNEFDIEGLSAFNKLSNLSINQLSIFKKSMLLLMFPTNSETKPAIRFKGFNQLWKKQQLGNLVDFLRGKGLSWDEIHKEGKYKCILYGHLYTAYGMVINEVYYSTNSINSGMVYSKKGDILIPSSDTTPTGLARAASIENDNIILGGDINILRPKNNILGSFLSYNINSNRNELIKLIKGTTVKHIYNSDIKDVELYLPENKDEQNRISDLFQCLDILIELHTNEIEVLKSLTDNY